jgi:UPF0755 protein
VVLAGAAVALRFIWSRPFSAAPGVEKFVVIPHGTSSYETAHLLEREGVVRHWAVFLAYLKLAKPRRPLQAGEYRFAEPLSVIQVADKLIRGLIYYREFTVPEGNSLFEIVALLEQKGFARAADLLAAAVAIVADLSLKARNLEGFLFPDTYRCTGTTRMRLQILVRRFRKSTQRCSRVSQSPLNLPGGALASLMKGTV